MALDFAAEAVAFLKPGKAKLVRADTKPESGGSALGSALAAALPIPGLAKDDPKGELTFMFNPTEYKIAQSSVVKTTDAKWPVGGMLEWTHTGPMTVSMQLFFDDFASARGDVTPKINKLLDWQRPTLDGSVLTPPPLVKFEWGKGNAQLQGFKGIITQINVTYTVFRKDGTPLQAKVDVTMLGTREVESKSNPTSHSTDMRRVRTVIEGETIASIAYAELGRPAYWRAIAEANGIDDPLRLKPGQQLFIPSAADAARKA